MGIVTISKNLISIKDLDKREIEDILNRANFWANSKTLSGTSLNSVSTNENISNDNPVICNLFFEPSTRTRFSFEVAARKLGYHVLNFDSDSSSTQKGETVYDTIKTLEAMGTNIAIIRTKEENLLQELAPKLKLALVNAGSGTKEHPSQCLLDMLTMKQEFGKLEGLKVAIVGDIRHSRVASSNISGLSKFGAQVLLSGPEELQLSDSEAEAYFSKDALNAIHRVDIDTAISEADVVMMLRVQRERIQPDSGLDISEQNSYHQRYGLTLERAAKMQAHAKIMHPAPFNRGIEIDGDLVESPRSLIYKQVSNGVAVRMAILERALRVGPGHETFPR